MTEVWLTDVDLSWRPRPKRQKETRNSADLTKMATPNDLTIQVTVTDRPSLERRLNEAESIVRTWAMQKRQGILVTRHDFDSFTVAPSDAVPFGLTVEQQSW
jgi:hypothetical protein